MHEEISEFKGSERECVQKESETDRREKRQETTPYAYCPLTHHIKRIGSIEHAIG